MAQIPNSLHCLYSSTVEKNGEKYIIEIPRNEIEQGSLSIGETFQVGVFESPVKSEITQSPGEPRNRVSNGSSEPPVEEGEAHQVTIQSIGAEGDGIAKVDGGYTLIVPDVNLGDEVDVVVTSVRDSHAFTQVVSSTN